MGGGVGGGVGGGGGGWGGGGVGWGGAVRVSVAKLAVARAVVRVAVARAMVTPRSTFVVCVEPTWERRRTQGALLAQPPLWLCHPAARLRLGEERPRANNCSLLQHGWWRCQSML